MEKTQPKGVLDKYKKPVDAPVLPSMAKTMDLEFVVNENGDVLVLHDKVLPDMISWVEYDMDFDSLTFVTINGKIFGLGYKVHEPFRPYLSKGTEINIVWMDKGAIADIAQVPLVVRYENEIINM